MNTTPSRSLVQSSPRSTPLGLRLHIMLQVWLLVCVWSCWGRLYKRGEQVLLQMNHVRPFNNPAETYNYYDLPFCVPSGGVTDAGSRLGDALAGDRRKSSAYSVDFKSDSSVLSFLIRK